MVLRLWLWKWDTKEWTNIWGLTVVAGLIYFASIWCLLKKAFAFRIFQLAVFGPLLRLHRYTLSAVTVNGLLPRVWRNLVSRVLLDGVTPITAIPGPPETYSLIKVTGRLWIGRCSSGDFSELHPPPPAFFLNFVTMSRRPISSFFNHRLFLFNFTCC